MHQLSIVNLTKRLKLQFELKLDAIIYIAVQEQV